MPSLIRVAPFLLSDNKHFMSAELCKAGDKRRIVGIAPVSVELNKIFENGTEQI
jgi:hypothetical protein